MRGSHVTSIRFILAFNQSLYNNEDLSEFMLAQVIPSSNYFTRLSIEQFPSLKDKFFKKTKYLSVMDWIAIQSEHIKSVRGLSLQYVARGNEDVMMSGFAGGG